MNERSILKGMRDELLKLASEEGGLKLAANRLMRALRSGEVTPEEVADAYAFAMHGSNVGRAVGEPDLRMKGFMSVMRSPDYMKGNIAIGAARDEREYLRELITDALSAKPLHDRKEIEYLRHRVGEKLKDLPFHPPDYPRRVMGDLLSEHEEGLLPEWQPYTTGRRLKVGLGLRDDPLKNKVILKRGQEGLKDYTIQLLPELRRIKFMRERDRRLAEAANQAVSPPPDLPAIPAMEDVGAASSSVATERPVIQAVENAATEPPAIKAIQHMGPAAGEGVGKKPMNPWLKRGLIGAGLATAGLGAYGLYRALSKGDEEEQQEAQPTVAPPPVTPGV